MAINKVLNDQVIGPAILKDLAEAVLVQAVRDLKNRRYELQLDAFYFLAGDNLPVWLAAAIGEDPRELENSGVEMLASGRANELKRKGNNG
jgi:hypothetical protein